tara:strand:- start:4620 stop:5369 length:750 start_codon:yes stop_codon:yes gene_type:complete
MKIALCLSGQPRAYSKGYKDLKKYYLDVYDVDVFIHTWNEDTYRGTPFFPGDETDKVFEYDKGHCYNWLLEQYNPKSILFDRQIQFIEKDFTGKQWRQSFNNSMSMWYSILKANELKINYEKQFNFKYDYVIRSRTDINFQLVLDDIESYNKDEITMHKWKTSHPQVTYGYKDCFAIGGSDVMNIYSSLYNYLVFYLNSDTNYRNSIGGEDHIRNEYFLKWHLDKNKIKINEVDTGTDKIGFTFYRDEE